MNECVGGEGMYDNTTIYKRKDKRGIYSQYVVVVGLIQKKREREVQ